MAGLIVPYGTPVFAIANHQRVWHGTWVSRSGPRVRILVGNVVRAVHARYVFRDWLP